MILAIIITVIYIGVVIWGLISMSKMHKEKMADYETREILHRAAEEEDIGKWCFDFIKSQRPMLTQPTIQEFRKVCLALAIYWGRQQWEEQENHEYHK